MERIREGVRTKMKKERIRAKKKRGRKLSGCDRERERDNIKLMHDATIPS